MTIFETDLASPVTQSFGWALLHSLWQGIVVAIFLKGVLEATRRSAANARYLAGCAALALMLVLPVLTVIWSPPLYQTEIAAAAAQPHPAHDIYAYASTTPNKQFSAFALFSYTIGQLDYDLGNGPDFPRVSRAALLLGQAAPFDPGPGNQITLEATVRYQPTVAFQTQLNYNKVRLVRNDTGLVAFDDNIFSSRSTYQFTRNTFARLRLDYSTLRKNIRPQFVLGWTPNPGTALYIGYNDDVSHNGYNPYTGLREPGLRGNGRTFFIKASYLFRKSF